MGTKPLPSLGGIALQIPMGVGGVRPEPVVEFARKKSPAPEPDSADNGHQLGTRVADPEFAPAFLANCLQIVLPRDIDEPLVIVNDRSTAPAIEAYKSLRTRLIKSQTTEGFRSIAITSVGRSDGKTVTAFNLACCCAQVENLTTLLIDGDLRSRSLSNLLGLPSGGLAHVLDGSASCQEAVVRTDIPNLCVMGAGKTEVQSTEVFSTVRWKQVIRWAQDHFKLVLVDALSMGALADFELIAGECERILVVVRARSTSREALKGAINQLDPRKLAGVVLNAEHSKNGHYIASE